jgi:hypothetical protein
MQEKARWLLRSVLLIALLAGTVLYFQRGVGGILDGFDPKSANPPKIHHLKPLGDRRFPELQNFSSNSISP